ncbi:alpha/beta fold hydrolase [Sinisalibacter aestuarii]|uniref:Hydrolase n=1 Tax=Sinisalibacter aestuarii TaxID=2949426 RepID=A0ABQ5LPK7_9RHOB|nr:alpha/beta hydrolase [Sinisalibacter aestuarii]GKY86924.1 hydrolase [Sinisalibacter aestuarii]
MTWLILLVPAAILLALPAILEAMRRPIDDRARDYAPGRFADLGQGRTHYQWHGGKSTHTIVLVHGLSSPSWVFSGLIRGLVQAGYRVLSYDLYGRGYSDRAAGRQTLAFHTAQLGALLDDLGVDEPVTLMGYSMGGAIAAQFAADQSDRVERLILLAPAGMEYRPGRLLKFAARTGPLGTWLWGLFGGAMLRRGAQRDAQSPSVIADLPHRIAQELRHRGYLAAILSSERHTLSTPMEPVHREIAAMYIPTLAIWGEKDPVVPITAMGELTRWNRQAHHEVVPGAGHALAYTNPQEVNAAVRTFLRDMPD